jgi:predicted CoA-binding protein
MTPTAANELLHSAKTIAIVGVSNKADRPSYGVAEYLMKNSNYDLFFVNPAITELFGKPVYPSLEAVSEVSARIDIVDVFRKIEDMPGILDEAIAIGAKSFWMQLGLRDDALADRGRAAGLIVIQDLCIKIEHEKSHRL